MANSEIYGFMQKKLAMLDANTSKSNANLAKLRRAVGKLPEEAPDVWDVTLQDAPEVWFTSRDMSRRAESAVHVALTLYSVHRQGKNRSMRQQGVSLGTAVGMIVRQDRKQLTAITRKFNMVLTAVDFHELVQHVRGLIQLMKRMSIRLDYAKLADELYYYQLDDKARGVALRWGEDFYKTIQTNTK